MSAGKKMRVFRKLAAHDAKIYDALLPKRSSIAPHFNNTPVASSKHVKVAKTDPARFRRTTRANHLVHEFAAQVKGDSFQKAEQIAKKVLEQIPGSDTIKVIEKRRIFARGAGIAMAEKKPIGPFHCVERCNLALALLNASGVKSWLARVIVFNRKIKKVEFHDYVEFSAGGGVCTLMFTNHKGTDKNFVVLEGPVELSVHSVGNMTLRALDSKQIGGTGNWNEYKRFERRISGMGFYREIKKNERRIELLQKEGLMPHRLY